MLFNSVEFALFFAAAALIYFRLPARGRVPFLLVASYLFYARWRWPYTGLLVFSTLLDYTAARLIHGASRPGLRRLYLLASLFGNLGVLFFFKYLGLALHTIERLSAVLGFEVAFPPIEASLPWYTLPIGISFYTFQTMSYTIDVYRGVMKPSKNILHVALYVCYFPQLVAGPIMRGPELLPQFARSKPFAFDRFRSGLLLCFFGLFKKVCLADHLAAFVDPVYAAPHAYSGPALLLATYAFAFQIYCDFSGYSDIAVGLARILGHDLILNFHRPYLAADITDFWRRWHISLSRWLKDYLYIPLGGNRCSRGRMYLNLMVTMLLGGLWHGANWTFVVWGGLHGAALAAHKMWKRRRPPAPPGRMRPVAIAAVFHFVCLTWIFFRAGSLGEAFRILLGILTLKGGAGLDWTIPCLIFAFMILLQAGQEKGVAFMKYIEAPLDRWPCLAGSFFYTAMVLVLLLFSRGEAEFIYFRF